MILKYLNLIVMLFMLRLSVGLPTKNWQEESLTTRSGLIIDFKENLYPNDAEWREHKDVCKQKPWNVPFLSM